MAKITLEKWGDNNFDPSPKVNTLRKWARDGYIYPAPIKHGRSYYVDPAAQYLKPGSLASRIARDRHGAKAA
ncbi:excisionase [Pseudomonas sp. CCI3.2]|uniref:excisionase n=1 Tax=unclassified Pseudomonas TaxID=196821 RepID=UPI002AC8A18B|nr:MULTISPECIES: excisionase [unclassified Pseudomonas]MEB0076105.1 excisionase [Pseudomonas sp. MH10out]MEB0090789.1 excisionase [Pseudomonas sp. CCI4.2]MEB0100095.1 excisionase [Pseudomonas sp. CCI3.2]MEB0132060.1 excisionase [Pseudomonas sp. CCI2.4]MEB0156142.1 excisionase [Pseudomonas sp. AH2 (2023)]